MGRGRPAGTSNCLYDLYKVVRGKEVFVGRMRRKTLKEKYGLSVTNLRHDINSKKIKPGKDGKYRIRDAGEPVEEVYTDLKPIHCNGMPQHVSRIKTSSSCRFGG